MQFPGYWVYEDEGKVVLQEAIFDETEHDLRLIAVAANLRGGPIA
jgi:hypothetical protein